MPTQKDSPTQNATVWAAPAELISGINNLKKPLIVCHVVPDADALGSSFALARALSSPGCRPTVVLPAGSLSQKLEFLVEWAGVNVAERMRPEDHDGFISLDTAKQQRCNVGAEWKDKDWTAGKPLFNIDHHDTNTGFGRVNWILPDASSSAEIVYRLLKQMGRAIDAMTASLLFAGIHSDTAGFSLPNTTAESLAAGAELTRLGGRVAELGERLCRSQNQSEFDLLRVVYANTRLAANGAVAYSTCDYAEIARAGCTAADIDDQVSVPRSLRGVRLSFLLSEGNKDLTRINFRGEGDVNVLDLAKQFGGGGHAQAAGAVVEGSIPANLEKILSAAVKHLAKF